MNLGPEMYARIRNSPEAFSPVGQVASMFWSLTLANFLWRSTWGGFSVWDDQQPVEENYRSQVEFTNQVKSLLGKHDCLPVVVHFPGAQIHAVVFSSVSLEQAKKLIDQFGLTGFIYGADRNWFLYETGSPDPVLSSKTLDCFLRDTGFMMYLKIRALRGRIKPGISERKKQRLLERIARMEQAMGKQNGITPKIDPEIE